MLTLYSFQTHTPALQVSVSPSEKWDYSNLTLAEKFMRVMERELGGSWHFLLLWTFSHYSTAETLFYWFTGLSLAELEVTTSSFWLGTRSVRSQWPGACLPDPSASWDSLMQGLGIWQGLGILQHPSLTPSSLTDTGEGGGRGSWGKGWGISSS